MIDPGSLDPLDPWAVSANRRFRRRWRTQRRWATALAVIVHAAAFVFSPTWEPRTQSVDTALWEADRLLVLPFFGEGSTPGDAPSTDEVLLGELEPTELDAALVEGGVVSDRDPLEVWEALGERLRRGEPLVATITEPTVEPEPDIVAPGEGAQERDEDAPSIGGNALTTELAMLPEPDSLSLDRLSALRPELAFMTAAAWVLIRNHAEVEAFLRRGYRLGRVDPSAEGSVSVTLWIDRTGSVEWAEITESSGRNDLDEFALAVFNEVASFRAARERGVYVSRSVTFSISFPW